MQKKSVESLVLLIICIIELFLIIVTLCYYGYRDIKKPISGTFCTQINVDVVQSDSISFFGDGTYMDTNTREYKNIQRDQAITSLL